MRSCHIHGTTVEDRAECPDCVASFEARPNAQAMTPDERVAEMDRWSGVLEVNFDKLHKRVEELVGRPVWTHEMASTVWPMLVEEARTQPGNVDLNAIMEKVQIIKPGAPTLALVIDGGAP